MKVLIVESQRELGLIWQRHLERLDAQVTVVHGQASAIEHLRENSADVIILDLVLEDGSPLTVSDYACFRQPEARVVFVTNTSFFSDGSIFAHAQNACGYIQSGTPPEDLAAMVEHYATA